MSGAGPSEANRYVRVGGDDCYSVSWLDSCFEKCVGEVLYPLGPATRRYLLVKVNESNSPDGVRVEHWVLDVRMRNCELVGIDLRCAQQE